MRFRAVFLWCIWLGLLQLSVGARVRHYKFDVEYMMRKPDCLEHVVMGINGQFPGPTIRAKVGDTLDIAFTNKLHTEGTVIHWHGIRQLGTPWADGTAAISQCAINPGETYHYRFTVDRPGTYFYHGHYGMQRAAGKYSFATGVIIVASFSVLSFLLGWIVGPWPLFCALLISFLLGTTYSINDPLLRWKRFAVVAAMCILAVRAIIAQLAFFLYMQLNLSCLGKLQYPSLPINCGGLATELEGNAYEADKYSHGISNFVHCLRSKWVHSSKRVLIKDEQADFVTRNVVSVIINNSGYHHTILMVPLSLYYVGFCMLEGNCQEILHFAEVQFYGDHKFSILGRDCVSHFLIQWNGEVVKEAIWEEEFNHKRQFLNLRLEDKSVFSTYFVP